MIEIFCIRLKELRQEKGISQLTLAHNIGATQKAVDFWEKGIYEPKISYVVKIAQYFDVTLEYLVGLED